MPFTPSFMVDAQRFGTLLAQLRDALPKALTGFNPEGEGLGHDRGALTTSLQNLLASLAKHDLQKQLEQANKAKPFRSANEVHALAQTVTQLQAAWIRRAQDSLGDAKTDLLRRYLNDDTPDILAVLGRGNEENTHSDVIAWLLNPRSAPGVAPLALQTLARLTNFPEVWAPLLAKAAKDDCLSVRREVTLAQGWSGKGELDRIDITITGPGFFLAIENKVWSSEHNAQTNTYWEWMKSLTPSPLLGALYLTPTGALASCAEFRPCSYGQLVAALLEGPTRQTLHPREEAVLKSYVKSVANHVLAVELKHLRQGREP